MTLAAAPSITALDILACPQCGGGLVGVDSAVSCRVCGTAVATTHGKPVFTAIPDTVVPSVRKPRGPNVGTVWRRANWGFYADAARDLPPESVVVDVGAGQGDFKPLFASLRYVAMDIYPYADVDVVCDVVQVSPLRPRSVDVVILSNVLEHVYDGPALLQRLGEALKPGGRLLIAVPFIIKLHQVPHDFVRYTHFALLPMLTAAGFAVDRLQAVYAPFFLSRIGSDHLRASLPGGGGVRLAAARAALRGAHLLHKAARRLSQIAEPQVRDVLHTADDAVDPYPIGYQIDARLRAR